jgi:hypothetical protein
MLLRDSTPSILHSIPITLTSRLMTRVQTWVFVDHLDTITVHMRLTYILSAEASTGSSESKDPIFHNSRILKYRGHELTPNKLWRKLSFLFTHSMIS